MSVDIFYELTRTHLAGEISAVTASVRDEGNTISDCRSFSNSAIRPTENKNQKHTLFAMLILYGSRPICNEHLEGPSDDLSYITAKVGSVSTASRAETLTLKDKLSYNYRSDEIFCLLEMI